MLKGKQKAQLLLALLENKAQSVLSALSPESARLLTSTIEDAPSKNDPAIVNAVISEVLERMDQIQSERGSADLPSMEPATEEPLDLSGAFDTTFTGGEVKAAEPEEEEEAEKQPFGTRDIPEVATMLESENSQLVAFVLANLNAAMREKLLTALPERKAREVQDIKVEDIPVGGEVFQAVYDYLFKKKNDNDKPVNAEPALTL